MDLPNAVGIARKMYSGFRIEDKLAAEALSVLEADDAPESVRWAEELRRVAGLRSAEYPRTLAIPARASTSPPAASGSDTGPVSPGPGTTGRSANAPVLPVASAGSGLVTAGWVVIVGSLAVALFWAWKIVPASGYQRSEDAPGDSIDAANMFEQVVNQSDYLHYFNWLVFILIFGFGSLVGAVLISGGHIARAVSDSGRSGP